LERARPTWPGDGIKAAARRKGLNLRAGRQVILKDRQNPNSGQPPAAPRRRDEHSTTCDEGGDQNEKCGETFKEIGLKPR